MSKPTNAYRTQDSILELERRVRASGRWPPWRWHDFKEPPSDRGWLSEVTRAAENGVFVVLVRPLVVPSWGNVIHAMIRTASEADDVTWAERQRIKNMLFGRERTAIEVFPPESQLVDQANMWHLWVFPIGFALPVSLRD